MTDVEGVGEFFGSRAARWDTRFPDDEPAFGRAVAAMRLEPGNAVLDAGCGTGRAVVSLRAAVGPNGTVVAVDATPEMLAAAVRAGRDASAALGTTGWDLVDVDDGEDQYLALARRTPS